jgi:hypothetical protein
MSLGRTSQKNFCFLISLPSEIVRLLSQYFLNGKDQEKKVFQFCQDWRNFMNTSKSYFGKWKKESQLIVLQDPLALQFYQSSKIRQQVLSYIEHPRLQLDLCFNNIDWDRSVDLESVLNVRRVHVGSGEVVPCSVDFEEIEFKYCSFTDNSLRYYSRVKRFYFIDDTSEQVLDLEPLHHIETGLFHIQQCENYYCLTKLQSLDISGCLSVTDVTCFQHIPKLTLSQCPFITDISSLGNVRELDLSFNEQITDVSSLGRVPVLRLYYCKGVKDVSKLNHVRNLDIGGCYLITDISGLDSVEVLNISGCSAITSLSSLSLKELKMKDCKGIQDFQGLTSLRKLEASSRETSSNSNSPFSLLLTQLTELSIFYGNPLNHFVSNPVTHFNYFPFLERISVLNILDYIFPDIIFPSLLSLRSLTLESCKNIPSLRLLPALGYLNISYCHELRSLHIIGSPELKYPIYKLEVKFCSGLQEISFDRRISHCRFNRCEGLQRVFVHKPIDLLKFHCCKKLHKIINKSLIGTTVVVKEIMPGDKDYVKGNNPVKRDPIRTEKRFYNCEEVDIDLLEC